MAEPAASPTPTDTGAPRAGGPRDRGLQGVDRIVSLFEIISASPGTLSAIAQQAGLSDATTLRYLTSLVTHGLVERDPTTRRYRIGIRLFALARSAIGGRDFIGTAGAAMTRLVETVGETVNLGARAGDELVILHSVECSQPIRRGASIGERDFWHSSGLGKAVLSTYDAEEVAHIVDRHGLAVSTPRTLGTADDLMRDLDRTRIRGYALDDEEAAEGLRCVAVPLRDGTGRARYALSVSGPSFRLSHQRLAEVGDVLREEADLLESLLALETTGRQAEGR